MRIRVRTTAGYEQWSLVAAPYATIGALAAAVGLPRSGYYAFGGVVVAAEQPLGDVAVLPGMILELASPVPEVAAASVVVVDGPDTGRCALLAPGEHILGRHPCSRLILTDPAVGAAHLDVVIGADGSATIADRSPDGETFLNGARLTRPTTLGRHGEIRIGATTIRFAPVEGAVSPVGELRDRREVPRHRAPRHETSIHPEVPAQPTTTNPPGAMASVRNLVSMVVPTTAGALLAWLVRPELAMFAMLGPVGALVTWAVLRVCDARSKASYAREHAEQTQAHTRSLEQYRNDGQRARRTAYPDMGELARQIRSLDPSLWQRRRSQHDFAHVSTGTGRSTDADALVELHDVPIAIDLAQPVGIIGQRVRTTSLARSLVMQLVTLHGPADLQIAVFTDHPDDWNWARWLPHCVAGDGANLVISADDDVHATGHAIANTTDDAVALTLVVVDAHPLPTHWRDALRSLLGRHADSVSALMCAPGENHLLEQCTTIVTLTNGAQGLVRSSPVTGPDATIEKVNQLGLDVADELAAHLAPLRDGARRAGAAALAEQASLLDLLSITVSEDPVELHTDAVATVSRRWAAHRADAAVRFPIGAGDDGPFCVDLIEDGPHGLLAGTTGSGKSELLRTLVLSLAATVDPEHLAMLLVDYKGGSAFDGVSALPHVVDVLTDLDPATARRAMRGLNAEVRHREELLRSCEAGDIVGYHARRRTDPALVPLPRLAIVVDEFATLAAELPDFVDALVDIAQRGRSLGIHLLLATQRPSGAVKDAIRTNANLRIALRVLDPADSRDVLGVDDAARLSRRVRGRGLARLGAGDVRRFQSAYVGMSTPPAPRGTALIVDRVHAGRTPAGPDRMATPPSDLDRLVAAIAEAHRRLGTATAPRPWSSPLPDRLRAEDVSSRPEHSFVLGLTDRADCRGSVALAWDPRRGNALFAGLAGRGTTTALTNIVARALESAEPVWVYVVAAIVAPYAALAERPEFGAVVGIDDRERVERLMRTLEHEVQQRRHTGHDGGDPRYGPPRILVAVDGVGALRSSLDSLAGLELLDAFERVAVEGPAVGVHMAFAAEHPGAVGHRLERTVGQTFLLGAQHGEPPPGRGVHHESGLEVQLIHVDANDVAAAVSSRVAMTPAPEPAPVIGRLPDRLDPAELPAPTWSGGRLAIRLGIGENHLAPAGFDLGPGDQVLICGPARSGKSAMIRNLHAALVESGVDVVLISGARRRTDASATLADAVEATLATTAEHHRRHRAEAMGLALVVLIDDADCLDDSGAVEQLAAGGYGDVALVAAARGDRLRGLFRHWTVELRRSGRAVMLRPDEADADLLGVRLPRSVARPVPGRGWIIDDGAIERCQFPTAPSLPGPHGVP